MIHIHMKFERKEYGHANPVAVEGETIITTYDATVVLRTLTVARELCSCPFQSRSLDKAIDALKPAVG